MLPAKKPGQTYERRRPELTPCYRILQDHLSTFIAERQAEGRPLPDYIIEEFEAYMRCGIPAHGFLRLACTSCSKEKIVAFSCKKRGYCPSCCAKRMAEAAHHLIDNVLPFIPYRQFVISFPIPMRYWIHTNKKLFSSIHKIVTKEIHRSFIKKAESLGIKDPTPGTISFTQRFGSALNLNPHLHILCSDGVYTRSSDGSPRFRNMEPISDSEVEALITTISQKIMNHLKRKGYLDKDGEVVLNPEADDIFAENDSLTQATASSIAGKIAFGPNAGRYVTRIGSGFGYGEEIPLAKGKRCFSINGFSLHANTTTATHQRDRLRKLIEYIARGPLSNERLEIRPDGKVLLQLKTPWRDGTSHLLFTPSEFIEKLAAITPPPRAHLVRWAGVFAPNSPFRKEITLKPEIKKGFEFRSENKDQKAIKNYSWSKMLEKVFKIDVSTCESCGADMVAVCSIMKRESIIRYLKHINIDYDPPERSPPGLYQGEFDFDQTLEHQTANEDNVIYLDS